jgi:hypothetical protein
MNLNGAEYSIKMTLLSIIMKIMIIIYLFAQFLEKKGLVGACEKMYLTGLKIKQYNDSHKN